MCCLNLILDCYTLHLNNIVLHGRSTLYWRFFMNVHSMYMNMLYWHILRIRSFHNNQSASISPHFTSFLTSFFASLHFTSMVVVLSLHVVLISLSRRHLCFNSLIRKNNATTILYAHIIFINGGLLIITPSA